VNSFRYFSKDFYFILYSLYFVVSPLRSAFYGSSRVIAPFGFWGSNLVRILDQRVELTLSWTLNAQLSVSPGDVDVVFTARWRPTTGLCPRLHTILFAVSEPTNRVSSTLTREPKNDLSSHYLLETERVGGTKRRAA
jgi:hypothetical protein